MNVKQPNSSVADWTKLLGMLSLAFGAWWVEPVLHSERPASKMEAMQYHFLQDVDARLWQDPIDAVTQTKKENAQEEPDIHDISRLKQRLPSLENTLVIGTMIHGGASPEQMENRRRTRYAVLAALYKQNYVPNDSEHIGYINMDNPPKECPKSFPRIAFEQFKPKKDNKNQNILLLWIVNDALKDDPKPCIQAIFKKFPDQDKIAPILIGPSDSNALKLLLDHDNAAIDPKASCKFTVYSPFATTEFDGPNSPKLFNGSDKTAWCLTRTVATNEQFVKKLIGELNLRKVDSSQTIALIGQWDTEYSRNLIETFKDQWKNHDKLLLHTYLRGVDGRLPSKADETEQKPKDKSQTSTQESAANNIERPEGDQQMDYLRRIGVELKQKETDLFSECSVIKRLKKSCGIRAIGLLGDDYYDKLLTLQLLRKQFPDALFFTTDLEAAMLHPEDNAYTRNLIVASGYDLTLKNHPQDHDALQGEIPPFRNSYQTAVFFSIQLALCNATEDNSNEACEKIKGMAETKQVLTPHIFEIGRTEAVPLNAEPTQDGLQKQLIRNVWLLLSICVFVLLLPMTFPSVKDFLARFHGWIILGLFIALGAVFAWFQAQNRLTEPLAWFEGVSIWPSELIRLISLLLSHYLLRQIFTDLKECNKKLKEKFYPDEPNGNLQLPDPNSSRVYLSGYINFVDKRKILIYARAQTFLMLMFGMGLMMNYGFPATPARGDWPFLIDSVLTLLSVYACLLMLFSVVRITAHAVALAKALTKRTSWPETVMEKHGFPPSAQKYFGDWLDVLVIATVTEPVGRFIFYPLWPLLLLYTARSPLFDQWSFPPGLVIVMLVIFSIAFYNAWLLRQMAESMRAHGLHRLNESLLMLIGKTSKSSNKNKKGDFDALAEQGRLLSQRISNIHEGAFAPLSEQPAIQAFITAVSAISGLKLAEYFTFFSF